MFQIVNDNLTALWYQALGLLLQCPESSPRGMKTREAINPSLVLTNPRNRYLTDINRLISPFFAIGELKWILSASNDLKEIEQYSSKMKKFSDDGVTLHGAYGKRIFEAGPFKINQLDEVVEKLKRDNDTRQAVITLWDPSKDNQPSKDIPCTNLMQFFIRQEKLHMIVYMRSNDIWLGTPYDIHQFTVIQEIIAKKLNVELGNYHHNVGSLHIYENNYEGAIDCIHSKSYYSYKPTDVSLDFWNEYEMFIEAFKMYKQLKNKEAVKLIYDNIRKDHPFRFLATSYIKSSM